MQHWSNSSKTPRTVPITDDFGKPRYQGCVAFYTGEESIAEFVARMRAEHGLPPKCSDPAILGRVARELVERRSDQGIDLDRFDRAASLPGRMDDDPEH